MDSKVDDDYHNLQQQIQKLQLENKSLNLRVQGFQVLGKVLQESHEENSRLKQEVSGLKENIKNTGLDMSEEQLSLLTTSMEPLRCYLSKPGDLPESSQPYEYVNLNPNTGEPSTTLELQATNLSSLAHGGDLHIKELRTGFKTLKDESVQLIKQAENVLEAVKRCEVRQEGNAELTVKMARLLSRLQTHGKEAKTRESLLWGLASEEELLKEKFVAIETEQISQEKIMEELKRQMVDEKEELERLEDEVNFMNEAVLVRKEDVPSSRDLSSSCTSASHDTPNRTLSSSSEHALHVNQVLISNTQHACSTCLQYLQHIKEMQQLLEQTKNERNEAVRQKEEILDVNHAWDAQYKKFQAETGKEITELRQQVDILHCGDQQKKFDKLWLSANTMMESEKKAKEQAQEQERIIEERCLHFEQECKTLAAQLEQRKNHVVLLQDELRRRSPLNCISNQVASNQQQVAGIQLSSQPMTNPVVPSHPLSELHPAVSYPREAMPEMINEIEVLKQQLRVYADDFASERKDRERMQDEKEKLGAELTAIKEQVSALEEQLCVYEEDFQRERLEKDRLRRQLQSSQGSRTGYGDLNQMTRKAQAVAEQQARLRAIREQYNLEERRLIQEQQELQQQAQAIGPHNQRLYNPTYTAPHPSEARRAYGPLWQQQSLHARGPIESPTDLPPRAADEMFHGGEVQPDNRRGREVVDGTALPDAPQDHANQINCPRCLRSFPQKDQQSLNKHIEKCIE